jgi:signal peptidase complex subunit 3
VIWDRIVRRKEDAVLNVVGKNKYMFRELSSSFRLGRYLLAFFFPAFTRFSLDPDVLHLRNAPSAHYALKYNIMPYVGVLTFGEAGRTLEGVTFPEAQARVS